MKRQFGEMLTRTERRRMAEQHAAQEAELVEEIVEAAEKIATAIGPDRELVFRTDSVWKLLTTIDRSKYCCSLSDIARLKKTSRQYSARLALEAAGIGLVDLVPNAHDRRIVQVLLTEQGRAEINRARHHRRIWIAELLLGLDAPRLRVATHVVRTIRRRLTQAEQRT